MRLDDAWAAVREFHLAARQPVARETRVLDPARQSVRARWLDEEVREFVQAETLTDQVDAVTDLIYFALGALVEMGVRPDRPFELVHAANMRKLERPRWDGEGKVLKPQGWTEPDLNAAISEQAPLPDPTGDR